MYSSALSAAVEDLDRERRNLRRNDRLIDRFQDPFRAAIKRIAATDSRVADLAASFPAVLFALAAPRQKQDMTAAVQGIRQGLPLIQLAHLSGLPAWTRKLPPEAFAAPIPALPSGDLFSRQIPNFIPSSTRHLAEWLSAVAEANDVGDETIALWVARQLSLDRKDIDLLQLRRIALWAWFSMRPDLRAHSAIEKRWTPAMSWKTAERLSSSWEESIEALISLGEGQINDVWFQAMTIHGYEFHPVRSAGELIEEAAAMQNCLRTYGNDLVTSRSRIWSIRKDGRRVASLEVSFNYALQMPLVEQVNGRANAEPKDRELYRAVRDWMKLNWQDDPTMTAPKSNRIYDQKIWMELWRPYWMAKRRIPSWLPLKAGDLMLFDLERERRRRLLRRAQNLRRRAAGVR